MTSTIATLIKYLLLGVTMLAIAALVAVGAYTILAKYFGYSLMLAALVSLVSTIGAGFLLTQFLRLWWDRLSATVPKVTPPVVLPGLQMAGRFGDLSNEWFSSDASLELEYNDFSLPHFQPDAKLLQERGQEASASSGE